MELLLLRHSITPGNLKKQYVGITDQPLAPEGEALAREKRKDMPPVEALWISPMLRCRQTARILFPELEPVEIPDLRECNFGDFEGRTWAEIKDHPAYQAWMGGEQGAALPNGESVAEFYARCRRGFQQVIGAGGLRPSEAPLLPVAAQELLRFPHGGPGKSPGAPPAGGAMTLLALRFFTVLLPAVLLDLILGDPRWLPHPVRWMGRTISALEPFLRRAFPKTHAGERIAGGALVLLMAVLFGGGSVLLLRLCGVASPWLAWGVEVWFSFQLLSARDLQAESMAVYPPLKSGDLEGARAAVSRIVGRDTSVLDGSGVAKAAVETVAENTCDGVISPLIFLFLGGLPLGMAFKAVSTLDSMVGYRTPKYQYFGTAAAKLDDVLNFVPARLSGILMCLGAALLPGCSGRRAWRSFWRDRKKHASPNSAHSEAACAGALGVQLAGDAQYFGTLVRKPTLGEPVRPVEPEDIARACRLMYATEGLTLLLLAGIGLLLNLL